MGYKIVYEQSNQNKRGDRWLRWIVTVVLLCLAITNGIYYCSGNLTDLREKLMPWTQPNVHSALCGLQAEIRAGEPLGESVAAFCREILDGTSEAHMP
jgi:hypothetical protein